MTKCFVEIIFSFYQIVVKSFTIILSRVADVEPHCDVYVKASKSTVVLFTNRDDTHLWRLQRSWISNNEVALLSFNSFFDIYSTFNFNTFCFKVKNDNRNTGSWNFMKQCNLIFRHFKISDLIDWFIQSN